MKNALFVLVLLLAGCVSTSTGVPIDQSKLVDFKVGITTEEDVVLALGNPLVRTAKSDGSKMLMYYHSQSQARGIIGLGGISTMDISSTSFLFDSAGKLLSHQSTESKYGSDQTAVKAQ